MAWKGWLALDPVVCLSFLICWIHSALHFPILLWIIVGEKYKLSMPLFLCNPQSSFCSNLIQLSWQQEAERRHAHSPAELLPFPLTPSPMEQHPAFPVIYSKTFCAVWFTSALPNKISVWHPGCIFYPLSITCWQRCLDLQSPGWGFCVHPEAHGCSYICRTDSSLENFSTKWHKLCVRRGLHRDLLLPERSLCSLSLGC